MQHLGRIAFGIALVVAGLAACGDREPPVAAPVSSDAPELSGVRLYERADRVTRLYGAPMATGGSPRASAEAFRVDRAAALGVDAGDLVLDHVAAAGTDAKAGVGDGAQGLMYDRATGKYRFSLYRYRQERDGIPVYASSLRVVVQNEPPYSAVLAVSALKGVRGFSPRRLQGVVDRAKANAAVRAERGRTDFAGRALGTRDPRLSRFSEPELVVWAGVEDDRVAPRVAVSFVADNYESPGAPRPEKWRFVADAETGDILHRESLIVFDVGGNVSGRVTSSAREMRCDFEVATPFPHADARIVSGNAATTEADGDYVVAHSGSTTVTVESPVTGKHFEVFDADPLRDEVLQAMVLPPGPANFEHNALGVTTEFLTAQANGYSNANAVRDWVLSHHPTYPDVFAQVRFPVVVNRTDTLCPGNAWYDGSSVNFCRSYDHPAPAQQDYGNTSYASIAQHEFGHHLVQVAGSGQGAYGEGMGDVVSMLVADDSRLGLGFFLDECDTALRDADNTCQYDAMNCSDCGSEIHDCGNLLSGAVWDLRQALDLSDPANALDIVSSLAVNSILLHTGESIDPQITIDFLTLDDDDGNLDNGTPHRTEICSAFGAHGLACPPLPTGMTVSPTADFASSGPEGGAFAPASKAYTVENLSGTSIDYEVTTAATWLTLTNASGTLAGGAAASVTLQLNAMADALPRGVHTATVAFTNLSDGEGDTTREVELEIGRALVASWNLETNPGWTAQGGWAFGVPEGGGGTIGDDNFGNPDPTSGATGTNVYGYNLAGNYSNDVPERHLTSTAIDLSQTTHVVLKFKRWLCVEEPLYDHAYVRVSADGTNWTDVWENPRTLNGGAWEEHEIDISGVANLQPAVYLRWTMGETDGGWRYCGWNIDDVEVSGIQVLACTVPADCDDGLHCNGAESCDAGDCAAGTPVACDDGIACTDDFCDEAADACAVTPDDDACDNGTFCDGSEVCDEASGCMAGSALTCDDAIACTLDNCSEVLGCVNTPIDLDCDDGVFCDGVETCHNVLGCVAGLGNPCDDSVDCTTNECVEATDSCSYVPDDDVCDDGLHCDGDETCDATLDCQAGAAVDCSDGIGCTTDSCDEALDACDHLARDVACDDGLHCNGEETCDALLGCEVGSNPCVGMACNEASDVCEPIVVVDAGAADAGPPDAATSVSEDDAGSVDAAPPDAGAGRDAAAADASTRDAGPVVQSDPPAAGTGGVTAGGDASVADDAGSDGGGSGDDGCGCRAVGRRDEQPVGPWFLILFVAGVVQRLQRAHRRGSVRADAVGR